MKEESAASASTIQPPPQIDVDALVKLLQDAHDIQDRIPDVIITDDDTLNELGLCKFPSVQYHVEESGLGGAFSFDGIPVRSYKTPELAHWAAIIASLDEVKKVTLLVTEEKTGGEGENT